MMRLVTFMLLIGSLGCSLWLIVGSFVTYTPSVTANDIQNIYLAHITQWGGASCALQLTAIVLLIVTGRTPAVSRETLPVGGQKTAARPDV